MSRWKRVIGEGLRFRTADRRRRRRELPRTCSTGCWTSGAFSSHMSNSEEMPGIYMTIYSSDLYDLSCHLCLRHVLSTGTHGALPGRAFVRKG